MTLEQRRRAEQVCAVLCGLPQGGEEASALIDELRLRLRLQDDRFDPGLGEAIGAAQSLLARLRERPPGTERRKTPRYPVEPALPARIGRQGLDLRADAVIADVGLGGLKLVASPATRLDVRRADPLEIAVLWSDVARAFSLGGIVMSGVVAWTGSDDVGLTFNVRFDQDPRNRSVVHRWVGALALRASVW